MISVFCVAQSRRTSTCAALAFVAAFLVSFMFQRGKPFRNKLLVFCVSGRRVFVWRSVNNNNTRGTSCLRSGVAFRLPGLSGLSGVRLHVGTHNNHRQRQGTSGTGASLGHDRNETTCVRRSLIDSESHMNRQVCGA